MDRKKQNVTSGPSLVSATDLNTFAYKRPHPDRLNHPEESVQISRLKWHILRWTTADVDARVVSLNLLNYFGMNDIYGASYALLRCDEWWEQKGQNVL